MRGQTSQQNGPKKSKLIRDAIYYKKNGNSRTNINNNNFSSDPNIPYTLGCHIGYFYYLN